jgi:hypothetical protein
LNFKRKYYIAVTLSISCLLISTFLNITNYMKNKRYESHLNEALTRNVKNMGISIVNADVMLSYVIDSQTITREQVEQLYFQSHEFAYCIQELEELYVKVTDKQSMFNPVNQYHFEIFQFFEHLRNRMENEAETVRKLSNEELIYYKRLFNLTECYTDVLQEYTNTKLTIAKEGWLNFLMKLSNIDNSGIIKNNDAISL